MSASKHQAQPEETEDERRDALVPTSSSGSDRGAGEGIFLGIFSLLIPPSPFIAQVKT